MHLRHEENTSTHSLSIRKWIYVYAESLLTFLHNIQEYSTLLLSYPGQAGLPTM